MTIERKSIAPGQWWRHNNQPYAPAKEIMGILTDVEGESPIVVTRAFGRQVYEAFEVFDFIECHSEVKESE